MYHINVICQNILNKESYGKRTIAEAPNYESAVLFISRITGIMGDNVSGFYRMLDSTTKQHYRIDPKG